MEVVNRQDGGRERLNDFRLRVFDAMGTDTAAVYSFAGSLWTYNVDQTLVPGEFGVQQEVVNASHHRC